VQSLSARGVEFTPARVTALLLRRFFPTQARGSRVLQTRQLFKGCGGKPRASDKVCKRSRHFHPGEKTRDGVCGHLLYALKGSGVE
jgi:hypothetical protein